MNTSRPESPEPRSFVGTAKHSWMMLACCIPMLAIAIALVATGIVGPGFLFVAMGCTAMMALMMRGMDHGDRTERDRSEPDRFGM